MAAQISHFSLGLRGQVELDVAHRIPLQYVFTQTRTDNCMRQFGRDDTSLLPNVGGPL